MDLESASHTSVRKSKSVLEPPSKKPKLRKKVVKIPRRAPSVVIPPRPIVFQTADKITCVECPCYPKESPYMPPDKVKLNPCLKSPKSLYDLAEAVISRFKYPDAFNWTEEKVADWIELVVGFPNYRDCFLKNHVNGKRLILFEDPSLLPRLNIRYFDHILKITAAVRALYGLDFILFLRSVGLPPRRPLVHCTLFKSRTGPTWGIRQNFSRGDILRWMKIINPKPIYRDHWDLVWYLPPDFPKTKFGKIPKATTHEHIPMYIKKTKEKCMEYMAKRKFRVIEGIPEEHQYIWMEHRPGSPVPKETDLLKEEKKRKAYTPTIPKKNRLDPPPVDLTGLIGRDLLLARRRMPTKKFLEFPGQKAP